MRRTTSKAQALTVTSGWTLPRGWIVLSAALASWAMVAVMTSGVSQLFSFVASSI